MPPADCTLLPNTVELTIVTVVPPVTRRAPPDAYAAFPCAVPAAPAELAA